MRVLVAYASKHGGTRGIAARIAETLDGSGLHTQLVDLTVTDTAVDFDAAVVGSAVYVGRWMKQATAFVTRHEALLRERPLWLFSSGPVGRPADDAKDVAKLRALLPVRDHRTFDGVIDAASLSLPERLVMKALKVPAGDYRDWDAVDGWAQSIVAALQDAAVAR